MVSTEDNHSSRRSILEQYSRRIRGSGQINTCRVVSGSCPQHGQRALSHSPRVASLRPVVEWPETNLEYHIQNKGEATFKATDKDGKLIRGKPVGEIYCFFHHVVIGCTVPKMPKNLRMRVQGDHLVIYL